MRKGKYNTIGKCHHEFEKATFPGRL